jgi:hypothetical protein
MFEMLIRIALTRSVRSCGGENSSSSDYLQEVSKVSWSYRGWNSQIFCCGTDCCITIRLPHPLTKPLKVLEAETIFGKLAVYHIQS